MIHATSTNHRNLTAKEPMALKAACMRTPGGY